MDSVDRKRNGICWLRPRPGSLGISLARSLLVLHLDELAPRTPQLPHRRLGALTPLTTSAALHVALVVVAVLIRTTPPLANESVRGPGPIPEQQVRHLVFLAPQLRRGGGGGGGVISSRRPSVAPRASARTRSPCEPKGAAANVPVTTAPRSPPRTVLRSRRSCLRRTRWLQAFRADRIAGWRHDVRHVDRSRVRGRRGQGPGPVSVRAMARDRPRNRRWNRRRRVPPWRGSIHPAPDQRNKA